MSSMCGNIDPNRTPGKKIVYGCPPPWEPPEDLQLIVDSYAGHKKKRLSVFS